jgi:hypothetical protein
MKVSELMRVLSQYSPDAEVVTVDELPIVAASTDGEFVYLSDYTDSDTEFEENVAPVIYNGLYSEILRARLRDVAVSR